METLLKADIFFVVTTVSVVAITLVLIIALVYLIFVLRELRGLMRRIRQEGEEIMDDVKSIREGVEQSGAKVYDTISWFGRLATRVFLGRSRRHDDDE